ncbi:MAG TPA: imidazole glycerol phosphate synthase subunit HisH [Candidatus Latescibacteria bacterium]|nr:imidazole glycerol phosphate synthase subunit HisH [Candidatus Latescibacterota bacterium]
MIAVIDYGMGNLRSVEKAFQFLGFDAVITDRPEQAEGATHLVLPGDAAFGDAMRNLVELGWDDLILKGVEQGKPFLGICMGLQLMFDESEEGGKHRGLGMLPGRIVKFPATERVPQIGWNQIAIERSVEILDGVPEGSYFYFVHSYYVDAADADRVATTEYGLEYTSIAARDNALGVQFHPEKSQQIGLRLLRNFARLG